MPLTLRATGLAPPVYEDLKDYEVLADGQSVGRIYEMRAPVQPDELWFGQSLLLEFIALASPQASGRRPSTRPKVSASLHP